jgi:hypothetical protein
MSIRSLLASAALTATLAAGLSFGAAGAASAQQTFTLCTEDPVSGCVAALAPLNVTINVASDGEAAFHPFGISSDVSDAIEWDPNALPFVPIAGDPAFNQGFWSNFGTDPTNGFTVWALPASTPCGNENEPVCEPVAHWLLPGFTVSGGPLDYLILENPADGGGLSDVISLYNDANGVANMSFASDPFVPEPATWGLMLAGVGMVGAGLRMRRKTAAAIA